MVRREFLRGLLAGGAAVGVTACGGGGGSGSSQTQSAGTSTAPAPSPVPAPTPAPPPVPTLRGVTIDQAQADIAGPIVAAGAFFEVTRTPQVEVTVTNADQFQAAVDQMFDTTANAQALAVNQRILCAWNGASTLAAGSTARLTVGAKTLATGHMNAGGSLVIAAAPGYSPEFANTVYVAGRGIQFQGIGFARRVADGETPDSIYSVILFRTPTYPVTANVAFFDCRFGSRNIQSAMAERNWAGGINTSGHVAEAVLIRNCSFIGQRNAVAMTAKILRIDQCDFQAVLKDCIALRGHAFESGYYAHIWVSRTTFRNSAEDWAARSAHSDAIQTGAANDQHLGYRLLVTDAVAHRSHKFSGEAGQGGGTQGIWNSDFDNADNQFVVRRSIFLATSPHGFAYFSPKATRPSFVDQSVFMRSGTVPSAFAPDIGMQDFAVGITGSEPAGGPWLLVTDTIAKNMMNAGSISVNAVDPRAATSISVAERPESVFSGRDFARGGAAVNGLAGKFGYSLPNEAGTQARFVADVWANFQPLAAHAGKGVPNLTATVWSAS